MRHVISILVEDRFGALSRIVELFTSRGYNLESISSGECEEKGTHRLTLVCTGEDRTIQQIIKLLKQIVYVVDVTDLTPRHSISRELVLVKMLIDNKSRSEILELINAYQGTIIEMNTTSVSFEAVGSAVQLDGLIDVFRQYKIVELARTGEAGIHR